MMINVGCGRTPTAGYRNFDNSLSLRLSQYPICARILKIFGFIDAAQYEFIGFCRTNSIEFADAIRGLPLPDSSARIIYSSHMFEHLDRTEAIVFLDEAKRILVAGGILRLAVPDIRRQAEDYLRHNDADKFISDTCLSVPSPRTIAAKIRAVIIGNRHHLWAYDGQSLSRLLASRGFVTPRILKPGETSIANPGNLDLHERSSESVYVEAEKP